MWKDSVHRLAGASGEGGSTTENSLHTAHHETAVTFFHKT